MVVAYSHRNIFLPLGMPLSTGSLISCVRLFARWACEANRTGKLLPVLRAEGSVARTAVRAYKV